MTGRSQKPVHALKFGCTVAISTLGIVLSAGSAQAQTQPDVLDDVFYQFMPISWRDSTVASDTTRDTISGVDRRFGDFVGMTDSLDYLQQLGVTAVWINPIFPSPAYHGYQHGAIDQVNSRFGTEAEFLAFVAAAKAKGIKVYLDLVCYGISQSTTYYTSSYNNPASIYDSWMAYTNASNTTFLGSSYNTWNGAAVGFIHWDLRNPATRDTVIGWCKHWLDPNNDGNPADGVAGFRLDHSWVRYNQGPDGWGYNLDDFWTPWKAGLRSVNPSVFTFVEQADWGAYGNEFSAPGSASQPAGPHDAAFTKPFEFAARDALANANASSLYSSMATTALRDPGGMNSAGTFLGIIGDHDVDRLASVIGASTSGTISKAKAAAAVLMLQPFPPIIYYGDELAMLGTKGNFGSDANDIPMREPMKWTASETGTGMTRYWTLNTQAYNARFSQNNDGRSVAEQTGVSGSVLETYRALITLRRNNIALRRGTYTPVTASSAAVWAFHKNHLGQKLVVAINLSGSSVTTGLNLSALSPGGAGSSVTDVVTSASATTLTEANKASYSITIPAYSYRVLSTAAPIAAATAPRVDGLDVDAALGMPDDPAGQSLAIQSNPTSACDNASELDQLFARGSKEGVFIGITGNIDYDATGLALFIDSVSGGQNVLNTSALASPPAGLPDLGGTRFDAGFAPDRGFFINASGANLYVDGLTIPTTGSITKTYRGVGGVNTGSGVLTGGSNPNNVQVAWNNGNVSGVTDSSAANAGSAHSGLEVFIPYAELGLAGAACQTIQISAMLVRSDGTVTNQVLPPVTTAITTDLGIDPNFTTRGGTQHASFRLPGLADVNDDGVVDLADFFAFLGAFDVNDPAADLNLDSQIDLGDFFDFLNAFDQGC